MKKFISMGVILLALAGCSVGSFFHAPLVRELTASRDAREQTYTQKYVDQNIHADVAQIAAVLDRMEDDYKQLKTATGTEKDESVCTKLKAEMQRIDDEVDDYMDSVSHILKRHKEKAFRRRNSHLFNFIQTMQSREFLIQMLD